MDHLPTRCLLARRSLERGSKGGSALHSCSMRAGLSAQTALSARAAIAVCSRCAAPEARAAADAPGVPGVRLVAPAQRMLTSY